MVSYLNDIINWTNKKYRICILIFLLEISFDGKPATWCKYWEINSTFFPHAVVQSATSAADIQKHLDLGKDLLARGQLADALTHYHAAVGTYACVCVCLSIRDYFQIFFLINVQISVYIL